MDNPLLQQVYLGNTLWAYLSAAALLVLLLAALRVFRAVVLSRLRKLAETTQTSFDDFLIGAAEGAVMPVLNYGAFYLAVNSLALSERLEKILYAASAVYLVFYTIRLALAAIRHGLELQLMKRPNGRERLGQLKGMMVVIGGALWTLGLVFVLDNLGYDVTAVVTGLGIGGIAIALAAQNILGDLFNYFVIFFDRPFEVGDFIRVEDKVGLVEQIGIKTTRIRSLTGEELVMSNTSLTSSRIHNFRRLTRRRAALVLGVTYGTPAEKLRRIPALVRDIVAAEPSATFDRCHFTAYGPSSLDFETVYYFEGTDFLSFLNAQERINLAIYEAFEREGVEFAFPTQTLHVHAAKA
jgi:small-conductance mechanosensitive channel